MAGLRDPVSDNTMPRYLYSFVASSGDELNVKWGPPFLLLNATVFVYQYLFSDPMLGSIPLEDRLMSASLSENPPGGLNHRQRGGDVPSCFLIGYFLTSVILDRL